MQFRCLHVEEYLSPLKISSIRGMLLVTNTTHGTSTCYFTINDVVAHWCALVYISSNVYHCCYGHKLTNWFASWFWWAMVGWTDTIMGFETNPCEPITWEHVVAVVARRVIDIKLLKDDRQPLHRGASWGVIVEAKLLCSVCFFSNQGTMGGMWTPIGILLVLMACTQRGS